MWEVKSLQNTSLNCLNQWKRSPRFGEYAYVLKIQTHGINMKNFHTKTYQILLKYFFFGSKRVTQNISEDTSATKIDRAQYSDALTKMLIIIMSIKLAIVDVLWSAKSCCVFILKNFVFFSHFFFVYCVLQLTFVSRCFQSPPFICISFVNFN